MDDLDVIAFDEADANHILVSVLDSIEQTTLATEAECLRSIARRLYRFLEGPQPVTHTTRLEEAMRLGRSLPHVNR